MRIIVDMDEVLAQFVKSVLQRWNVERGTKFTRQDINMWRMEETLGDGSFEIITKWMNEPGFFENLEPIPGAIEGFKKLMNEHDVVIATSLSSEVENGFDSKRRWLFNHIPEFDLKHFICTNRKELLKGDLLIDDASHYLRAWRHDGGNIKGIVMDAPWNRDVDFFPRAGNWNDVLGIVRFHVVADEYHRVKNEFHDLQNKFETTKIINSVDRTLNHVDRLMKTPDVRLMKGTV